VRLIVAVGARPNVVKVSSLIPELIRAGVDVDVAYSGDRTLLDGERSATVSFYGVEMMRPTWLIGPQSTGVTLSTGEEMIEFEHILATATADAVLVMGDSDATLGVSIAAAKAGVPVIHLEAGLRCGAMTYPDEINRVLISRVAAMHLTSTEDAIEALEDEGIDPERIHFVGSMLAESVYRHLDAIKTHEPCREAGFEPEGYFLASLRRKENLGSRERLEGILEGIAVAGLPTIMPDPHGLRATLESAGLTLPSNVTVVDAVAYRTMLALQRDAVAVLTDSGGVQEEACILGTPCVTVRPCTEYMATLRTGSNVLVDSSSQAVSHALSEARDASKGWVVPKRWDQAVSGRVVRALKRGIMPLN
jgi:UDP-N-acetylglucosamine 2-epimerase (non-hydrolysing)